MNVNTSPCLALSRSHKVRASETLNAYCGVCATMRTKPISVIEHVASSRGSAAPKPRIQFATRSWNSCSAMPSATSAFTSRRHFMEVGEYLFHFLAGQDGGPRTQSDGRESQKLDQSQFLLSSIASFEVSKRYAHPLLLHRVGHPLAVRADGESVWEARLDLWLKCESA